MKIGQFLLVLFICIIMAACEARAPEVTQEKPEGLAGSVSEESSQKEQSEPDKGSEAENSVDKEPKVSDDELFNEIMCIFGAQIKREYNSLGELIESDKTEYQSSVISFYYNEEGIPGTTYITPYGYFGWYLEYTLHWEEKILEIFPDYERMVVVRNSPVSGEIYGAPAEFYEAIVTSFFNVSIEELRSGELYDSEAHAYVPNGGPGRGEQPDIRVISGRRESSRIMVDILFEDNPERVFWLTVYEDEENPFAGIKFISLIPDMKDEIEFTDGPNGENKALLRAGDSFLGLDLKRLTVERDGEELWSLNANFTGKTTLRGRLFYEEREGPNIIEFYVAEESFPLLPYPVGDMRELWFGFSNGDDAVKQMVGSDTFDMECEIVIESYNIHFAYAGVWNSASLVEVRPL